VLLATDVPSFFLFIQLVVAVILFLICHAIGFIQLPFRFDRPTLEGLAPLLLLNVVGLRCTISAANIVLLKLTLF